MKLTIFDLDNTLIAGDSDHAWGVFAAKQGIVDPDHHRRENDRFYGQYEAGTLDIREYQRFVLQPLAAIEPDALAAMHRQFMAQHIDDLRLAKADALVAEHKAAGDTLLVITATNRFVAGPIVAALGIDNLLATEPEYIDGKLTGEIIDTPCFQQGKITRLDTWLQEQQFEPESIRFYSDSHNDLPLLQEADEPVAVDPDERLRQHAESAGWPVISLRD